MSNERRVNGLELLAAVSGKSEQEIQQLWDEVKAQARRTETCALHELEAFETTPFKKFRCKNCRWVPQPGELARYEQGLAHGRARAAGGGRS